MTSVRGVIFLGSYRGVIVETEAYSQEEPAPELPPPLTMQRNAVW